MGSNMIKNRSIVSKAGQVLLTKESQQKVKDRAAEFQAQNRLYPAPKLALDKYLKDIDKKKKSEAFPKAGQLGVNTIPAGKLIGASAEMVGRTIVNMGGGAALSLIKGYDPNIYGYDAKKNTPKGAAWDNMERAAAQLKRATSPSTYGSKETGGDLNFSLQTGDWLKTSDKIRRLKKRISGQNKVDLGIQ